MALDPKNLLTDDEVATFIIRGYHLVEIDFPTGFNESIYADLEALNENPGDGILDRVPKLHQVYGNCRVKGALVSLLGESYQMHRHRHCHMNRPGSRSQAWHQDGVNVRHHHTQLVLAMYYPQEVTADLGPTVVMPGTHFRNAPTDQLSTYANFREQVALTVKAGTVAITHYDLWHAAACNRGQRTRYMLKFLFVREASQKTAGLNSIMALSLGEADQESGQRPERPSWHHDPAREAGIISRFTSEMACTCSQSDHYKERGLRLEMWHKMKGSTPFSEWPGAAG